MEVVVYWRYKTWKASAYHQQTNIESSTGRMPFISPDEQCQSTEAKNLWMDTEMAIMPPPLIGGGIKRCFCLTSVCLSVTYIGPKSRSERPRKTKIGTEVAHVTRDSDTTFKVKRWKVKVTDGEAYYGGLPPTACLFLLRCFDSVDWAARRGPLRPVKKPSIGELVLVTWL